ncbi:preprotein translocase subunit SecE [Singulisphaera acidiphila]|uniref:Protein translocase subunit SecE n=1 Tax=Singulisphaera acidiphila (strain ATCC BAA-1392 / DSM 18658 / VKM B-2454 / MOB10) TaxID=886293 RepID=L0D6T7_SINAD|nr:preprotein translocase subunit SecE [Singulisphaera acidiphila]AGA24942.1 preprotein translocase, SecE subunit [Singulisphaera acidiphila DSM 18658]
MGKVKDGAPASKASKPPKAGATGGGSKRRKDFALFVTNLFSAKLHKPKQGQYARIYTAAGLGVVVALGLWRLYDALLSSSPAIRFGVPTAIGAAFAWFIFRLMEYPPFVEFLIATEAEMNKVSWTSRDDLYRATTVVLSTVVLMSVYLFGVDWVWSNLLQILGVLKFGGGGAFGSSAG